MSDNSTISTQYASTKMTTYESTLQPPKNNEQAVLTARPTVSGSVNTPISSSLVSALTRTAGTINQVARPPKYTIDPVITNDNPDIVPPVISRRAPSTPPSTTPPPQYVPTPVTPPPATTPVTPAPVTPSPVTPTPVTPPPVVTPNVPQNVIKNVYGASIDISNAERILGAVGYNYIRTDKLGYVMPASFNSNDVILGGIGTEGGIGNINLNGAIRLAGADRDETIKLIRNYSGTKNVYGAGVDLENAKNILGASGYNYIQTDKPGFVMLESLSSKDIILGGIGAIGGIGDVNLNGAIRLAGANRDLTAQAISNYNSPKYVYGAAVDLQNAKNLLGDSGYDFIQTDVPGFKIPSSFNSNDIILGGTGTVGGIGSINLSGATRLAGATRYETYTAIKTYASSKNVYGALIDLSNAKRILGTTEYNYIQTDQPGFVIPKTFTSNDIILGGVGTEGGVGNVNLNGAARIAGADRNDTMRLIKNYGGIKNVYGASVDLQNAKNILGTTGYNYIQTDQPGFAMPVSFSSGDIILGGVGTTGGIGDVNLNGAIRLAGANRDLTAQAINNYNTPKYVYGAGVDIENAKNILGTAGYNYIQTDQPGFKMPSSFNSNDIILGGIGAEGGVGNVNLNGAIRLAGANRDETYSAIKNYSTSKNVYGASVDLENARSILGATGYNYIQTDQPGFVMPVSFSSNDVIVGGAGAAGGIGNVNLNGATRLAGTDRYDTIRLIKNYAGIPIEVPKPAQGYVIPNESWGEVTGDSVNIRNGAGLNASILGHANKGEKIRVASREGDWYQVYWGDHGGWINSQYLKASSAPISSDPISTSQPQGSERYGTRVLKDGVEGDDVRNLQSDLVKLGYLESRSDIDGDYGPTTEAAVKSFQSIHGLDSDGKVGDATKGELVSSMKSYYASHPWDSPEEYGNSIEYGSHDSGIDPMVQEFSRLYAKGQRGEYFTEYSTPRADGHMPQTIYGVNPLSSYMACANPNTITFKEYIYTMGPQWEYEWNHKNELEDLQKTIDALSLVIGIAVPVAGIAGETANAFIDILHGNDVDALKRAGFLGLGVVGGKIVGKVAGNLAKRLEGITDARKAQQIIRDVAEGVAETEAKFLGSIKAENITSKSAEEVNNWWKTVKGYTNPPYTPGTTVLEFDLKETTTFVRVYDDVNSFQKGGWIMKKEDILGLTAEQIKNKYALPTLPKYITDVEIPAGTRLRIGEANPLPGWGSGRGTQIDMMGQYNFGEKFLNPRPLE